MSGPLTQADRVAAFRAATSGLKRRLPRRKPLAMTDDELSAVLSETLGTFGGRGGPGELHLTWQASGLKIWASWHVHNHVREKPVFAGLTTIAMAREVYGIADPSDRQLALF
jgi:hypothetical protein